MDKQNNPSTAQRQQKINKCKVEKKFYVILIHLYVSCMCVMYVCECNTRTLTLAPKSLKSAVKCVSHTERTLHQSFVCVCVCVCVLTRLSIYSFELVWLHSESSSVIGETVHCQSKCSAASGVLIYFWIPKPGNPIPPTKHPLGCILL